MQAVITGTVLVADKETKEKYQALVSCLAEKFNSVLSPLDTIAFKGTAEERFERAIKTIKSSDFILADVSYPSTGQGMELMIAKQLKKPLMLIAQEGNKVSGLIKGAFGKDSIYFYSTIDDAISAINHQFKKNIK